MNRIGFVVAGAAVVALTACSGFKYQNVEKDPPASNAFNQGLQKGYLAQAKSEFQQGDYIDSDFFSDRARAAGKGQPLPPTEIGARKLPADKVADLTAARSKLMAALGAGAATKNPAAAAEAQVMFNCWMEQQEENFQPKDIEACKKGFEGAMAKLEDKPVAKPTPPMATPDRFLVFFDWDKYNINAKAKDAIATAAGTAKKASASKVQVIGHTDTSGPADYNLKLSQRRADAVKKALVGQTLPAGAITTEARGERDLLVPTKDGVREAQNRRAEIVLNKPGS
ncbi:MAG: OmpA family protein [Defluviicoccus sp.]